MNALLMLAVLATEVNPFIGTSGSGHSTPGAAAPFGLVQAGPDTGWGTWDYCSGYQYGDTNIIMFSQTHTLGGGCPDFADVGIMPLFGDEVKLPIRLPNPDPQGRCTTSVARGYDKASETAMPGYYAVTLDGGVRVFTAAAPAASSATATNGAPNRHAHFDKTDREVSRPPFARGRDCLNRVNMEKSVLIRRV